MSDRAKQIADITCDSCKKHLAEINAPTEVLGLLVAEKEHVEILCDECREKNLIA